MKEDENSPEWIDWHCHLGHQSLWIAKHQSSTTRTATLSAWIHIQLCWMFSSPEAPSSHWLNFVFCKRISECKFACFACWCWSKIIHTKYYCNNCKLSSVYFLNGDVNWESFVVIVAIANNRFRKFTKSHFGLVLVWMIIMKSLVIFSRTPRSLDWERCITSNFSKA